MAASHGVVLVLSNICGVNFKYVSSKFDSGRLADYEQWPDQLLNNGKEYKIICVDKNNALAGASGSVTYSVMGQQITIGFSNPFIGSNKFSVVTTGHSKAMSALDDYSYNSHSIELDLGKIKLKAIGSATGGDTNRINLTFDLVE